MTVKPPADTSWIKMTEVHEGSGGHLAGLIALLASAAIGALLALAAVWLLS